MVYGSESRDSTQQHEHFVNLRCQKEHKQHDGRYKHSLKQILETCTRNVIHFTSDWGYEACTYMCLSAFSLRLKVKFHVEGTCRM